MKLQRLGINEESYDGDLTPEFFRLSQPSEITFLPTRLIDVDPFGLNKRLRLCHSKDIIDTNPRYMTLSHCWGLNTGSIFKTTKATLHDRIEGFDLCLLPPTFNDAVVVIQKLGLRYLWIDSICIIQDSEEDWNQEASMMGEIYSRSYCTLAASSSKDSSGGLLRPRNSHQSSPCILSFPSQSGVSDGIIIHPAVPLLTREESALQEEPLLKRAWTLQERDLSPRTIHFTDSQLMWECRSQRAMEAEPQRAFSKSLEGPLNGASHFFDTLSEGPSNYMVHWCGIVKDYSARDITFVKDRLPALSGLAKKMQQLTGDTYLAGLWKSDLIRGLCWQTSSKVNYSSRATSAYLAPSWSWASVDASVYWPYETLKPKILPKEQEPLLLHADIHLSGPDPLGRVSAGRLRVAGCAQLANSLLVDQGGWIGDPVYHRESARTYSIFEDPEFLWRKMGSMITDDDIRLKPDESVMLLKILEEQPRDGQEEGDIIALVLAIGDDDDDQVEEGDGGGDDADSSVEDGDGDSATTLAAGVRTRRLMGFMRQAFLGLEAQATEIKAEGAKEADFPLRRVGIARIYGQKRNWFFVPPVVVTIV